MVLELNTPSASSSLLHIPLRFSQHHHKNFKLIQFRNKSHISLLLPHCLNPLQHPRSTIHNHIFKEKEEEKEDRLKAEEEKGANGLEFVRHKKLLSELSTWGIGGPCNYFIQVSSKSKLLSVLRYCHEHSIRFLILGKGSNCLFDDSGFDGCIILNQIEIVERVERGVFRVGSGYPFNRLGMQCSKDGFTGLEFAGGIPGTVGGALYMNAGANGQETFDAIDSVEIISKDGREEKLSRKDLTCGYRTSCFQDMEELAAIFAVTFHLKPLDSARERQYAFLSRRRVSQPVGVHSSGSVFRNPPGLGVSAGELIEKAGMKGWNVGGAKVSEIHANFFINSGNSTSRDMLELINLVKGKVNMEFGIQMDEEIRYIPPL